MSAITGVALSIIIMNKKDVSVPPEEGVEESAVPVVEAEATQAEGQEL